MTDASHESSLAKISPRDKAEILAQALPYIRKFHGKTIVIKYGGNAMTDAELQQDFAEDVVLLKLVGMNPVVVHGGGPQIEEALAKIGKKGTFIQGMRVTDDETMEVVEWVLAGQVQQDIVGLINVAGGKAVGLTGRDGGLIRARKLKMFDLKDPSKEHDVGQVGEIESIDPSVVRALQDDQFIPVISPLGFGANNENYNINADVVAGKLAEVLNAEKLMLLTNTPGRARQAGQPADRPEHARDRCAVRRRHHQRRHAAQDLVGAGCRAQRRQHGAHHRRPRAACHAARGADRTGLRHDDPLALNGVRALALIAVRRRPASCALRRGGAEAAAAGTARAWPSGRCRVRTADKVAVLPGCSTSTTRCTMRRTPPSATPRRR